MGKGQEGEKNREHNERISDWRRDISAFDTGKKKVLMAMDVPYLKIIYFLKKIYCLNHLLYRSHLNIFSIIYLKHFLVLYEIMVLLNTQHSLKFDEIWWVIVSVIDHPHALHQRRQRHPTPVLLPLKSHGQRSLVGCSPWGR